MDVLGYSNILQNPATLNYSTFDSETSILSNTWTTTSTTAYLMILEYQKTLYSSGRRTLYIAVLRAGDIVKQTFTSGADMHYFYVKRDGTKDVGAYFPIEPLTTYTFLAKVLSTDMSVVGGMKLQLMLVRGEYPYDDIILPENMVYMP